MAPFQPGTVVVCEAGALPALATVIAGPHEDGSYDLDSQPRTRPEAIRNVRGGETVEYYSGSLGKWIPAQVLRKGHTNGTFDLDCKEAVDITRMRLPEKDVGSALPPPPPALSRPGATTNGAGGAQAATLRPGDHCFYKSSAHGWIPATVKRVHPEDGTFDLDVKQRVKADQIYVMREGEAVEYHSASANQWIPARVVRRGQEPGTFDLDCKEKVDLRRMRPPAASSGAAPPKAHAALQPASSQPLPSAPSALPAPAAPPAPSTPPRHRGTPEASAAARPPPAPGDHPRMEGLSPGSPPWNTTQNAMGSAMQASLLAPYGASAGPRAPPARPQDAAAAAHSRAARGELQKARWSRDAQLMRAALESARQAGLPQEELEPVERALAALEAQAALQAAARQQNAEPLRQAIQAAAAAGLPREELEPAERALALLDGRDARRQEARARLQAAVAAQDVQGLQEALWAAGGAGLGAEELEAAERALAAATARAQLHIAVQGRQPHLLREAMQLAASAGLVPEEVEPAKQALAAIEAQAAREQEARDKLQQALCAREELSLREALELGVATGLPQVELEGARRLLDALGAARRRLLQALSSGSAAELAEATQGAAQAGLPAPELEAARARLRQFEVEAEQARSLEELRAARQGQDATQLRQAMELAAACGLSGPELDEAGHALWALEARPAAQAELRRAASGQDERSLQAALEAAAVAGVPERELEAAARALRALEAARAQAGARERLLMAQEAEDPAAIRAAVHDAASAGVCGDELDAAHRLAADLEAKGRAREELARAEAGLAASPPAEAKARLRSALQKAEMAGLRPEEVQRARAALQQLEVPPPAMVTPNCGAPGVGTTSYLSPGAHAPGTTSYATGYGRGMYDSAPPTDPEQVPVAHAQQHWAPQGSTVPPTQPQLAYPWLQQQSQQVPATNPQLQVAATNPKLQAPPTDPQLTVPGTQYSEVPGTSYSSQLQAPPTNPQLLLGQPAPAAASRFPLLGGWFG